jgi:hypothetical protein
MVQNRKYTDKLVTNGRKGGTPTGFEHQSNTANKQTKTEMGTTVCN